MRSRFSSSTCAAITPGSRTSSTARSTSGFGALCLTVDTHHYSRRERDISKRYHAASAREPDAARYQKALDWKQFDKLKAKYKLPLIVKGIATAEDAHIAVEHGVDVIYVSNHGGRQLDQARARSTCCRRSSRQPQAARKSSSTAGFAAAPTY